VTDIGEDAVTFKEGTIETPNIIWAAGVTASPLLNSLNAEQDCAGRVKVNPDLSVPEYPDIFVIGDAACVVDETGKPLPALAPVAKQEGLFVGRLLKEKYKSTVRYICHNRNCGYVLLNQKHKPTDRRPAFHYVDKGTMATIGRAKAIADVRGLKFSGFTAWLLWSVVHILSLIGFRNRFRVFMEWVWYYFTFKRGVRLITGRSLCRRCKSHIENYNDMLIRDKL